MAGQPQNSPQGLRVENKDLLWKKFLAEGRALLVSVCSPCLAGCTLPTQPDPCQPQEAPGPLWIPCCGEQAWRSPQVTESSSKDAAYIQMGLGPRTNAEPALPTCSVNAEHVFLCPPGLQTVSLYTWIFLTGIVIPTQCKIKSNSEPEQGPISQKSNLDYSQASVSPAAVPSAALRFWESPPGPSLLVSLKPLGSVCSLEPRDHCVP